MFHSINPRIISSRQHTHSINFLPLATSSSALSVQTSVP
ncbi:TPA: CRISPR-associated DxTHG motif protein [Neisseria gonorrhoeae]